MSGSGDLRVVSATRDAHGGYIESLLARVAQAEDEVTWYRNAYQQAEREVERMARQLQRAFEQGFVIEDEVDPLLSAHATQPTGEPKPPRPEPGLAD